MKSKSSLLAQSPQLSLLQFQQILVSEGVQNTEQLKEIAKQTIKYLSGNEDARNSLMHGQMLENRWYESLATGVPDYSVYETDYYLAELWACWMVYSRKYLREAEKPSSLPPFGVLSDTSPSVIVDVGCGFGYTTATLKQLFPNAKVYATNLPNTFQFRVATRMAEMYGFTLVPDVSYISEQADLVFASEYFEHFPEPIEHLQSIVSAIRPKSWLIANAFTAKAIGHFTSYMIDGAPANGKTTSKIFADTLKRYGYQKIQTNLWNNRPSYWRLGGSNAA
jgi:SAM-dependent methyltransferase